MEINMPIGLLAFLLKFFRVIKLKYFMKTKLLFPLVAAMLFSQVMMAQFHIGIKGGANITKVDGQSFKDQFRYGYHIGGFCRNRAWK